MRRAGLTHLITLISMTGSPIISRIHHVKPVAVPCGGWLDNPSIADDCAFVCMPHLLTRMLRLTAWFNFSASTAMGPRLALHRTVRAALWTGANFCWQPARDACAGLVAANDAIVVTGGQQGAPMHLPSSLKGTSTGLGLGFRVTPVPNASARSKQPR